MTEERKRPMMPLPEFKKLLGPLAERLSEEQILKLRDKEYRIAEAVFHWWLRKHGIRSNADSTDMGA